MANIKPKTTSLSAFFTLRWGPTPSACQRSLRRSRRLIAAPCCLVIAALTIACTAKEVPYVDSISDWRAEKDRFMQKSSESPIPVDQRATFPPLSYFPIEPEYRVPASLTVDRSNDVIEIPTSRGERRPHNRVGKLSFTLKGRLLMLTAFVEVGQQDTNHLFVPFGDLTNGTETYPGGRYLELDRTPTGIYDLDFNRAYHPFCYYNPKYDCPYPPRENRLPIPIRAGERMSTGNYSYSEGLRPSDSPTRSLAGALSAPLRSRGLTRALVRQTVNGNQSSRV
jgi:uncharacterized protein